MNPLLECFGLKIQAVWRPATLHQRGLKPAFRCKVTPKYFYLSIPDFGCFLALPTKNQVTIEANLSLLQTNSLRFWMPGAVLAYLLQCQGYLVLHGSAVLINNTAIVFSGRSGAGKSTLADAFVQKGYPLITDDLVVIRYNDQGQYCIVPGPPQLKLWKDSLCFFQHDMKKMEKIAFKTNKHVLPVDTHCPFTDVPVHAFYEINIDEHVSTAHCEGLNGASALKTVMQNVYRYFMLKPLGKLPFFLHHCTALSQQINVYKLTRNNYFHDLSKLVQCIESNLEF